MMGVAFLSGIAGVFLVAGWIARRVFAQSRSEPALGERYVAVPDSDLTIKRDRRDGLDSDFDCGD
jgi:hypothetical protein